MTIGERLEEARKRRGVSVREAAEATKIRGDFLLAMEGNSMDDINLPELYKRGFLKNYGNFLRIDSDKLLTDYDALQLGSGKYEKRLGTTPPMESQKRNRPVEHTEDYQEEEQPRSNFGRMEIGSGGKDEKRDQAKARQVERGAQVADATEIGASNRSLYLKVGLLFGVGFLLVVLVFFLINLLRSNPSPEINPDLAPAASSQASSNSGSTTTQPVQTEQVVLEALDNVTVIINEGSGGEEIFRGTLMAGERQTLQKQGPIVIRYSNGSALNVEVDGRRAQLRDGVASARLQ